MTPKKQEQIEAKKKGQREYYLAHRDEIRARGKRHYQAHREERLAYELAHRERRQAYRRAHRERQAELTRAWNKAHRGAVRRVQLKVRYGLSQADYERLLSEQGGACAICQRTDWNGRTPHVDHDHGTGRVRGALCWKCNLILGHLGDNLAIAKAVIEYLKKHRPLAHGDKLVGKVPGEILKP